MMIVTGDPKLQTTFLSSKIMNKKSKNVFSSKFVKNNDNSPSGEVPDIYSMDIGWMDHLHCVFACNASLVFFFRGYWGLNHEPYPIN